jgi:hypothetical protein
MAKKVVQPFLQLDMVLDVDDDSSIQVVEQKKCSLSPSDEPNKRSSKEGHHHPSPHVKVHRGIVDSPESSSVKSEEYLQLDLSSMDGTALPSFVAPPSRAFKGKLQKNFSRLLQMSPVPTTRVGRKSAPPIPLSPAFKNLNR